MVWNSLTFVAPKKFHTRRTRAINLCSSNIISKGRVTVLERNSRGIRRITAPRRRFYRSRSIADSIHRRIAESWSGTVDPLLGDTIHQSVRDVLIKLGSVVDGMLASNPLTKVWDFAGTNRAEEKQNASAPLLSSTLAKYFICAAIILLLSPSSGRCLRDRCVGTSG